MRKLAGFVLSAALIAVAAPVALAGDHVLQYTIDGETSEDRLGLGVGRAGDVNGDGFGDFVAGAYYGNGSRPGYAKVFSGRDGKLLYTFDGHESYDGFGVSVNTVGDVNDDGYDDIIVGAYLDDTTGTDAGMAYVYSGKDGSELYAFGGDSAPQRQAISTHS